MFDEMCDGEVIFKFNTCPCCLSSEVGEHELLVISTWDDEDNLTYYALVRYNPSFDEVDFHNWEMPCEGPNIDKSFLNCKVVKKLTIEQVKHIIEIIENNKSLMMVNSEINVRGYDGPYEEYYFSCPSFNRHTEGFAILLGGTIEEEQPNDKETSKNHEDAVIVTKAFNEIRDYLRSLGVQFEQE